MNAIDFVNSKSCLSRATEAYLSGNKAAAKALSKAAAQINDQVVSMHRQAAQKIFAQRNAHVGEATIDLHGLHPDEAIDMLHQTLVQLGQKRYHGKVLIITGSGHHSKRSAKVGPMVWDFLSREGYRPQEATQSDGQGGMLLIHL